MEPSRKPHGIIQVGEWVVFSIADNHFDAQVIEDRGNLGVNGERILRISVPWGKDIEPREFEVHEDRLIRAA